MRDAGRVESMYYLHGVDKILDVAKSHTLMEIKVWNASCGQEQRNISIVKEKAWDVGNWVVVFTN